MTLSAEYPHTSEHGTRSTARGVLRKIAAPQGFTLSVGGTLAGTIAERETTQVFDIWLFVVGGSASFCLLVLITSGTSRTRHYATASLSGLTMLNLLPIVVMPTALVIASSVPGRHLGIAVAGALTTGLYLVFLVALVRIAARRSAAHR